MLEAQDVLYLSAAPRIDRLVIVPDTADVPVRLREQAQPEILHQIRVLVFVDQDIAEQPMVLRKDVGLVPQQFGHVQQQIAKIGCVQRTQPRLIGRIKRASAAGGEVGVFLRRHARRRKAAILPTLDHRHQRLRRPALCVYPLGLHDLLQQA